jgi:hypothetical protein
MFGLSLPPEFCRRAHVFFTLFVFVCLKWCPTHVVFLFCLSLFCEPYVASFSELSIFDCPFGIFYRLLDWLNQVPVGMIYRCLLTDRPFNLQGGGGYGFLFRSKFFFRTKRELEYLFFLSCEERILFSEFNIGYITKTLNQIIFFFLHQNQNIFFSNIGNQNIFLEKKP